MLNCNCIHVPISLDQSILFIQCFLNLKVLEFPACRSCGIMVPDSILILQALIWSYSSFRSLFEFVFLSSCHQSREGWWVAWAAWWHLCNSPLLVSGQSKKLPWPGKRYVEALSLLCSCFECTDFSQKIEDLHNF